MDEEAGGSGLKRLGIIAGCILLFILLGGIVGGIVAGMNDQNERIAAPTVAVLAAISLLCVAGITLLLRKIMVSSAIEPPTAKERLNRNILAGSGVLGGVIGLVLIIAGGPDAMLGSSELPPALTIALVVIIGGFVPAISWYWHAFATDEQESDAYKMGALGGIYVYMIGAPCWWFLWRGRLVPEPDGVAIYLITLFTVGIIWLWRKYR